jgi:hypothetical protein
MSIKGRTDKADLPWSFPQRFCFALRVRPPKPDSLLIIIPSLIPKISRPFCFAAVAQLIVKTKMPGQEKYRTHGVYPSA